MDVSVSRKAASALMTYFNTSAGSDEFYLSLGKRNNLGKPRLVVCKTVADRKYLGLSYLVFNDLQNCGKRCAELEVIII